MIFETGDGESGVSYNEDNFHIYGISAQVSLGQIFGASVGAVGIISLYTLLILYMSSNGKYSKRRERASRNMEKHL